MFECLKILLVLFLDMGDGEEVDGYSCMAYRSGATDTCAGDVVGVAVNPSLSKMSLRLLLRLDSLHRCW